LPLRSRFARRFVHRFARRSARRFARRYEEAVGDMKAVVLTVESEKKALSDGLESVTKERDALKEELRDARSAVVKVQAASEVETELQVS
jgi:hypothetical protein